MPAFECMCCIAAFFPFPYYCMHEIFFHTHTAINKTAAHCIQHNEQRVAASVNMTFSICTHNLLRCTATAACDAHSIVVCYSEYRNEKQKNDPSD
jgi:hypothetical protein